MQHQQLRHDEETTMIDRTRLTNRIARLSAVSVTTVFMLTAPVTEAAQPVKDGCPKRWVLSDPEEWLAATKAGMIAEGTTFEEQQVEFGFLSSADFEAFIIDGVFSTEADDANGDGWVCRATNTPSGYPEFFFKVQDNKYQAK